jgi:hypothetical protein
LGTGARVAVLLGVQALRYPALRDGSIGRPSGKRRLITQVAMISVVTKTSSVLRRGALLILVAILAHVFLTPAIGSTASAQAAGTGENEPSLAGEPTAETVQRTPKSRDPTIQAAEKLAAEIEKINLEAEEIRERLRSSKKWYEGRYLFESIVGGVIAGALFISWFVGFYSPRITLEKERVEFEGRKQQEKLEVERKEWNLERLRKEQLLQLHTEHLMLVDGSYKYILSWARLLEDRLKEQRRRIKNISNDDWQAEKLEKFVFADERRTSDLVRLLESDVVRGKEMIERLNDGLALLNNSNFGIKIVYASEYMTGIANVLQNILSGQKYKQVDVISWSAHRDDNEAMREFVRDGPVLLYDAEHSATSAKVRDIEATLSAVLPTSMVVKRYQTVSTEANWYTIAPFWIELWLFEK